MTIQIYAKPDFCLVTKTFYRLLYICMYKPFLAQFSQFKAPKSQFLQIMGEDGSGSRRLAFQFMDSKKKAVWISKEWRLYAPALWELAKEKEIFLMGIENPDSQSYRKLFYELYESNVFDIWILEYLHLNSSEGFFLQKLLKNSSTQIIVLDPYPQSFCQKRLKVFLSHENYRLQWTKGGDLNPLYIPAEVLRDSKEDICSL